MVCIDLIFICSFDGGIGSNLYKLGVQAILECVGIFTQSPGISIQSTNDARIGRRGNRVHYHTFMDKL